MPPSAVSAVLSGRKAFGDGEPGTGCRANFRGRSGTSRKYAPVQPANGPLIVGQFQAQVIPDDDAWLVAAGDGKGLFIFAGIQQGGGEAQGALRPQN